MEFPVLFGDSKNYPDIQEANCPVCKSKKVWGDNEYVEFSGGTVPTEKNEYECDLWLDWFSQKKQDGSQDHTDMSIVCEVNAPRFQLAFCSTSCLRKFLNSAVDTLESKTHKIKHS